MTVTGPLRRKDRAQSPRFMHRARKIGGLVAAEYPQMTRGFDRADVVEAKAELRALQRHALEVIESEVDNCPRRPTPRNGPDHCYSHRSAACSSGVAVAAFRAPRACRPCPLASCLSPICQNS